MLRETIGGLLDRRTPALVIDLTGVGSTGILTVHSSVGGALDALVPERVEA